MTSLLGIVPNQGSPSTKSSFSVTDCNSKLAICLLPRSMSVWPQFVVLHTKRLIGGFSAPNFPPAFAELRVQKSSESGSETGLLPVLSPEILLARPCLDQCSVHREMFIRHVRPRTFQHPPEKRLRDLFVQQTLPILAEHRVIPDRFVHLHPHKPSEQQVVLELLDQHSLTAHRIEDLQQQ